MPRHQTSLTGDWLFRPDPENLGEPRAWHATLSDETPWRAAPVPTAFDDCGDDMARYRGAGWFRRRFTTPQGLEGKRITLRFEGISYNARVWLNGEPVAENHDAFLPFDAEVGGILKPAGEQNLLVVRIDNIRGRGQFPLFEGWFGQGGFLRECFLEATDPARIEHLALTAEPGEEAGRLQARLEIANGRGESIQALARLRVMGPGGRETVLLQSPAVEIAPGETVSIEVGGAVPAAAPWSPDAPALYTAEAALIEHGGATLDRVATRFGFRRVEARDGRLLLNGEPIFLLGFNRHEDSPRTGMAVDLGQAREDFTAMKAMGANFVRLCHYPHHPGELDLCDELGLLVMIENAMNEWGHVDQAGGFELSPEDAPTIVENGRRSIRKMVRRDINHPSVILCSVGNESAEERPDVVDGNAALIEFGRSLDPSRPWTHVSNSFNKPEYSPGFYRADDVICVNVYPTHHCPHDAAALEAGLPESTRFMRAALDKVHGGWPDKPVVVTEMGFPISEGETVQAAAVQAEFRGLDAPWAAGAVYWCYAHHPWPTDASSGEPCESPYGYMTRDRKQRYTAMAVIERLFRERGAG